MNDSDNNINDDVNKTNRKTTPADKDSRTSDIYERFITRVQSINSDRDNNDDTNHVDSRKDSKNINKKVLKKSQTLAGFEPLSDEELGLFLVDEDTTSQSNDSAVQDKVSSSANPDPNADIKPTTDSSNAPADDSDIKDIKDDTVSVAPASSADVSKDQSTSAIAIQPIAKKSILGKKRVETKKSVKSGDKKQWRGHKSGGNLIIIGVVIALGVSAIILVALSATGQLPPLNGLLNKTSSNAQSEDTPVSNNPVLNNPVSDAPEANADDTNKSQPALIATDADNSVTDDNTDDLDTERLNDTNKISASVPEKPQNANDNPNQQGSDDASLNQNAQSNNSAISVDEFHEEAQSTLYRESQ